MINKKLIFEILFLSFQLNLFSALKEFEDIEIESSKITICNSYCNLSKEDQDYFNKLFEEFSVNIESE